MLLLSISANLQFVCFHDELSQYQTVFTPISHHSTTHTVIAGSCLSLEVAVGLLTMCLVGLLSVMALVGAVFGYRKWWRKGKRSRFGNVHARYKREVNLANGRDGEY